jgi:hypothetical protein
VQSLVAAPSGNYEFSCVGLTAKCAYFRNICRVNDFFLCSCQQCSVELTLNVTSTSDGALVVTSRDLKSADESVVPVDFDVDLAGLGQDLAPTR